MLYFRIWPSVQGYFFGEKMLNISLQNVWPPSWIFKAEEGWERKKFPLSKRLVDRLNQTWWHSEQSGAYNTVTRAPSGDVCTEGCLES